MSGLRSNFQRMSPLDWPRAWPWHLSLSAKLPNSKIVHLKEHNNFYLYQFTVSVKGQKLGPTFTKFTAVFGIKYTTTLIFARNIFASTITQRRFHLLWILPRRGQVSGIQPETWWRDLRMHMTRVRLGSLGLTMVKNYLIYWHSRRYCIQYFMPFKVLIFV